MICAAPKSHVPNLYEVFIFRLLSKIRFSISLSFTCGLAINIYLSKNKVGQKGVSRVKNPKVFKKAFNYIFKPF